MITDEHSITVLQGSQQSKILKQGFFSVHKKRIIINLYLFMESDITYCPLPHPPL